MAETSDGFGHSKSTRLSGGLREKDVASNALGTPSGVLDEPKTKSSRENGEDASRHDVKSRLDRRVLYYVALAATVLISGVLWWRHTFDFEQTDDAQVSAPLNSLSASVAGVIVAIHFEKGQWVSAGQAIAEIDRSYYEVALTEAKTRLAEAEAQNKADDRYFEIAANTNRVARATSLEEIAGARRALAQAEAHYRGGLAKLQEEEARERRAQADLNRYSPRFREQLVFERSVSRRRRCRSCFTRPSEHNSINRGGLSPNRLSLINLCAAS